MQTKKTLSKTSPELEKIEKELVDTMKMLGINPEPYSMAIRITAQTLYERDKAYQAYLNDGGKLVNDNGKPNPIGIKLATWNAQSRACLSMLKLTPSKPRFDTGEDPEANDSNE